MFNINSSINCCPYCEVFIYNHLITIKWLGLSLSLETINSTLPCALAWILVIHIMKFLNTQGKRELNYTLQLLMTMFELSSRQHWCSYSYLLWNVFLVHRSFWDSQVLVLCKQHESLHLACARRDQSFKR
jgi:uncharacterized Tic20 family protein